MRDFVGESPIEGVIDLDAAGKQSARPFAVPWRRWRGLASTKVPVLGVVGLVLLGVSVGAVAGQRWAVRQQQHRLASEVSLFVAVAGLESVTGRDGRVTFDGSVAVVNGGPLPVEVSGAAKTSDFMVFGQQRIERDRTARFAVSAVVSCSEDASTRPLPVELSVVTADSVRRAVTVQLQLMGSRWYEFVVQNCQLPR